MMGVAFKISDVVNFSMAAVDLQQQARLHALQTGTAPGQRVDRPDTFDSMWFADPPRFKDGFEFFHAGGSIVVNDSHMSEEMLRLYGPNGVAVELGGRQDDPGTYPKPLPRPLVTEGVSQVFVGYEETTVADVLAERIAAIEAYVAKHGFTVSAADFDERGVTLYKPGEPEGGRGAINANGDVLARLTWEELGFSTELHAVDDHHIIYSELFGAVRVEGGMEATQEQIAARRDQVLDMVMTWNEVIGAGIAPDVWREKFDVDRLDRVNLHAPDTINRNLVRDQQFANPQNTDAVVRHFLNQYDGIINAKQQTVDMLTEYYSREAILQRAEKAGFTDTELIEQLIEMQQREGQTLITHISYQGQIRLGEDMETNLTRNIPTTLSMVFGGHGQEFANDLARAALGLGTHIQIGNFSFTYNEYLHIESRLHEVYTMFNNITNGRESLITDTLRQIGIINELGDRFGADVRRVLAQWFDDTQTAYFAGQSDYLLRTHGHRADWSHVPKIII